MVKYTDNTSANCVVTGGENIGFQNVYYVTDKNKSVKNFEVYYYSSLPVYYRADSYIAPLSNTTKIIKQGILESSIINERDIISSDPLKYGKGYVLTNEIIEI